MLQFDSCYNLPVMSNTHRCLRCTAVLPESALFCRRCGAAQVESPVRLMPTPPQMRARSVIGKVDRQPPVPPPATRWRARRPWVNLLAFFCVIGVGLLFVRGSQQNAPTVSPIFPTNPTVQFVPQSNPNPIWVFPPQQQHMMQPPVPAPVFPAAPNRDGQHYPESHGHDGRYGH